MDALPIKARGTLDENPLIKACINMQDRLLTILLGQITGQGPL